MTSETSSPSYTSVTMSPTRANVIGSLFGIPLFLIPCGPYLYVWGSSSVAASTGSPLILIAAFIVGVIAHELLHGVGFMLGGASREEVDFGIHWHVLSPYAHCSTPLRADPYRLALVLPALVLGLLPTIAGLLLGGFWVVFFGAVMLMVAGGDAAVLWAIRNVPQAAWVQDHPSDIGCLVLDDEADETAPEPVTSFSEADHEPASSDEENVSLLTMLALSISIFVATALATFLILSLF